MRCELEADLPGTSDAILSVAVADRALVAHEALRVTVDGLPVDTLEIDDDHGGRLHQVAAVGPGRLVVSYDATIDGRQEPTPTTDLDLVRYVRPSRYCESDELVGFVRRELRSTTPADLVAEVTEWVGDHVDYVSGSSRPIDGAVATLLQGQGVCRDFAHLVIAMLRAKDVAARLASVYAPGLAPMDFHAVAEAAVDGEWIALDATRLAPRSSMVRIATGRDAADTAFLSTSGDPATLTRLDVVAVTEGDLPTEDPQDRVRLG